MSLQTPTTKDVSDNIIAQLEASLNQTIPLLPKSFMRVLAKALAGVFVILYKYCGFIFLQMFVQTASDQPTTVNGKTLTPLKEWGRLIGVGDPTAATHAELNITVSVDSQGGTLSAGSQLVGADNGVTYVTTSSVLLDAATVQVTARASSDQSGGAGGGVIGNLEPGAVVSFANPLAGVARSAVVLSQSVTGADAESTASYRQRVYDRFQKRPQGGAYADYEGWSVEVPGIINAYPYTGVQPGTVEIYVEATEASSGSPDGVPTTAQLEAVFESINLDEAGLASRRPANAYPLTLPISRVPFSVKVLGLQVDDEASVRTQITEAVETYFEQAAPFIPGLTIPPRKDVISRAALSGTVHEVVNAAGGIFTTLYMYDALGAPLQIYTLGHGEKAKSSGVTFV